MRKVGNLYFLQVAGDGPIKIGWTQGSPLLRSKVLQHASPYELIWRGSCPASRQDETAAHKLLAAYRVRNEWFHPVKAVLDFVAEKAPGFTAEAYIEQHCRPDLQARAKAATKRSRDGSLHHYLVKKSGLEYCDFWKWTSSLLTITPETAAKIECALCDVEQGIAA